VDHAQPDIAPEVHARRWRILGVLCLSLMIVMVANSSLNVALPSLARELHASNSGLQWVVDAYALVFAGLLFPAGTIGDRFGRKGALQGGLVVFLLGAVVAAGADSTATVIAARAVMGAGAAFVMPSTLSILTNVFPAGERGRAIATWAGVSAGGASIGPTGSGFLLQHFWWGSVFLVNVPVIVAALVLGRRLVPTSRNPAHEPLDGPGALLSMLGIGALVDAIIEGPVRGWASGATFAAFAVAAVALGLFVVRERTAAHPMLDLGLFRDRRYSVASLGILVTFSAMFGTWFLITQYTQLVLGYTPLGAGLFFLPFSLIMVTLAPQAPRLVARLGVHAAVAGGLAAVAAGLVGLSRLRTDSGPVGLCLAIVPLAIGVAVSASPLTALIMAAVPPGRAGVGSATNDTVREVGGALGIAILGSLATSRFAAALDPALAGLPAELRDQGAGGLAGALRTAADLPGPAGAALATAARVAYVDAFGVAVLAAAAVVVVMAAAAWALLPRAGRIVVPADEPAEEPAAA
jgi:EmrB/QacA subfamily drug resistance transporter